MSERPKVMTSCEGEDRVPVVPIDPRWIEHRWFIARTRWMNTPPGNQPEDVLAVKALARLGIPAWYATDTYRQRVGKITKSGNERRAARISKRRLAFPGYIFLANDGNNRLFAEALEVRHIESFMGYKTENGAVPMRIPGYGMQALFAGEDARLTKEDLGGNPLQKGETVHINEGAYGGFDVVVSKIISAQRIEVILKIFGRDGPVEISVDKLRRL